MEAAAYEVVVLAGGRSTRFGSDKIELLLDRTLAGLPAGCAVTCAGPQRATPSRPDVRWVREDPPGCGPLAAVAAALGDRSEQHDAARPDVVVVVGGDMPWVGDAVPALAATLTSAEDPLDAVLLADAAGRTQVLASAWHRASLHAAVDAIGEPAGVPLQRLLTQARVVALADRWGAAHDVDTPADLEPPPDTGTT